MSEYRPLYHCAAINCDKTRDDTPLFRVSAKGDKFVGLCYWHFNHGRVVLRPEAAALLIGEET